MRIAKRITAFFIARGVWDREQEDIYEYGVEIVINNLALTMWWLSCQYPHRMWDYNYIFSNNCGDAVAYMRV